MPTRDPLYCFLLDHGTKKTGVHCTASDMLVFVTIKIVVIEKTQIFTDWDMDK